MKTFSATHLNKHAQEVFDEVKEYGTAVIEHDRYRGGVFAIVWNPDFSEEEVLAQIKRARYLEEVGAGKKNRGDKDGECMHENIVTNGANNCRTCLDCGRDFKRVKDAC